MSSSSEDSDDCESGTGDETSCVEGKTIEVKQNNEELGQQETNNVLRLRLIVFLVLLLAAVAVSVIVYFITTGAEREEADSQFAGAAEKVLEAFLDIVNSKLGAVSSVGVAAIAHGVDHTRTWPFVTLSSFQQRSATARSLSDALYVHINPIVEEEDRAAWEEFVISEDASWM
jgi:hypothetical protein